MEEKAGAKGVKGGLFSRSYDFAICFLRTRSIFKNVNFWGCGGSKAKVPELDEIEMRCGVSGTAPRKIKYLLLTVSFLRTRIGLVNFSAVITKNHPF